CRQPLGNLPSTAWEPAVNRLGTCRQRRAEDRCAASPVNGLKAFVGGKNEYRVEKRQGWHGAIAPPWREPVRNVSRGSARSPGRAAPKNRRTIPWSAWAFR